MFLAAVVTECTAFCIKQVRFRYFVSAHVREYRRLTGLKKKKGLHSNLNVAFVPPSAGALGAVASGWLPDGPQAQGPLKG